MTTLSDFYLGKTTEAFEVPSFNGSMPCTMLTLCSVSLVEHSLPFELNQEIHRTQRWLDDTPPEVIEAHMGQELYSNFTRMEGWSFLMGRKYNEPPGIFVTPAINVEEHSLTSDSIIHQVYRLSVRDRHSAVFLCHPNSRRDLSRLTDTDGRFIMRSGVCNGDPDRLLDYPLHYDESAPENQLMFGNFREGYHVELRPTMKILRDPYTVKPNVAFLASRRVGAEVTDGKLFQLLIWK